VNTVSDLQMAPAWMPGVVFRFCLVWALPRRQRNLDKPCVD